MGTRTPQQKRVRGTRHAKGTPKFGEWVWRRRQRAGLTQWDLARKITDLGLPCQNSRIVWLEKGRMPSVDLLWALSVALRAPIAGLAESIVRELEIRPHKGDK